MFKKINKINGHEIFNIGTGQGISVLDLLYEYQKINNIKLNIKNAPIRKGDIPIS